MRIPIISGLIDHMAGPPRGLDEIETPSMPVPPDFSMINQPQFSEPFFRQQEMNLQVDSMQEFLKRVENSHLSRSCKNAWIDTIRAYYDRNILLSNLSGRKEKDAEIAFLRMKIDVIVAVRANAYKSDRANPEFVKFEMLLQAQMWHRFTRAKGEDREGVASRKIQFSYSGQQRMIKGIEERK